MSSGRAVLSTWAASVREAVATCTSWATFGAGGPGAVLVTGSSGKGTTCRMLAEVLRAARLHPVLAAETSRPWSAVTGTVARGTGSGYRRGDRPAIRLVEVEPAALRYLAGRNAHRPAALLCTNILPGVPDDDAAGATLTAQLERTIASLPATTTLILNADDPQVAALAAGRPNPRLYFGMSDPIQGRVRPDPTAEFPCCPRCGGRLSYSCVYYAHLGHWACRDCGLRRPEPDVSVTKIGLAQMLSSSIQVAAAAATSLLEVPLPGMYNAYNALAAVAVATHLGLPDWSLCAIGNVSGGPMRMERSRAAGHDVYLAVAADATGYTEVLRAILGAGEPRRLLLGLSARRYPHRDVSWIWDVDFEALAGLGPAPVVCGNRAADLAVRLKYAGWLGDGADHAHAASARIEPDPIRAVRAALAGTPPGQPLWIVSTVPELAEIRSWLRNYDRASRPAPRRTGTQPSGPQPSGPARSAPQPTAPPPSRHRPDRSGRRDRKGHRPRGRVGAVR